MFCSVMMSPESVRSAPQPRRRASSLFGLVPDHRIHAAPRVAALVAGFAGNNLANPARMNDAHRLLVGRMGARLEIDQKDQVLLRGFASALGHRVAAGHVHRNGLGAIDMFAGLDRRGGVDRVEIRRRINHHRVEFLFEQGAGKRKDR